MKQQKKFSIMYSVLLLAGLVLLSSCGDKKLIKQIEEQKEQIAALKDSLDRINEIAKHELLYLPNGDPKENIPICEAQKLYLHYNKRAELLKEYVQSSSPNYQPSRTISFDYQELVNYFGFIEKLTEKTGNRISRLRFFFGKYSDQKERYTDQQMLFFNPTILDDSGKNITYAIKQEGDDFSIIDINNLEEYDCPNNDPKKYSKGGFFSNSSSLQTNIISLEGQGGQIRPPDND